MSVSNAKALCFDTGGTILDWHTGMRTAFAALGAPGGARGRMAVTAHGTFSTKEDEESR
jgi:2-haloacid dehalogenase